MPTSMTCWVILSPAVGHRQLWGMFLHARDQLPFLHYSCTGWIQQSGEQRDLKGPTMRKETTVLLHQPLKTDEKSDD